jgi:CRISPR system Cascade subunit CasE
MMYLSRLELNPTSRNAMRDIGDVSLLHKRLMTAFPSVSGDVPRQRLGVLFRIDSLDHRPIALIQSQVEPNWSALPEAYCLCPAECKDIGKALERIAEGATLGFRLRANPTKRIPDEGNNPKRVALYGEEKQTAWFQRKAPENGFEPVVMKVVPEGTLRTRDGKSFESAMFEGTLRVVDRERLIEAVKSGIGPGKAYGFGLLTLAPHNSR